MSYIWEEYERQKEGEQKGITKTRDFVYPPILPIVYYEGKGRWTAVRNLKDRIFLSEVFEQYIPDFTYELISLREYTNEELAQKGDEMSLIMLLNRIQSRMDLNQIGLWRENLGKVLERTPEHVVNLIVKQIAVLAGHLNLSVSQTEEIISSVKERDMPRMYEFFEDFDLPKAKEEMKAEHAAAMAKVATAMEKVKEEAEKVKAEAEVEQERIAAEWERIAKERCELQRAREEVELLRENLRKATQEGLAN